MTNKSTKPFAVIWFDNPLSSITAVLSKGFKLLLTAALSEYAVHY